MVGKIKRDKRKNIEKEGKDQNPPSPQRIGNYPTWYLHNSNYDFTNGIQKADLHKQQPFLHKKQENKSIEKTQVFKKSVCTEFVILDVFIDLANH